jgi:hypothetical protein
MKTLQLTEEELKVLQLCLDVSYDHYDEEGGEEEGGEDDVVFKSLYEKVYNLD